MSTIAILIEKEFNDAEVIYPLYRLREAAHTVVIIGPQKTIYAGKYGYPIAANASVDTVSSKEFDGLIIPGGWAPDYMRRTPKMIDFVKAMAKKPIGAICHGGWMLASANIIRNKTVTGFIAIKDDLVNAGATYVDKEVVVDGNIITSRKPDDLPAFMREFLKKF